MDEDLHVYFIEANSNPAIKPNNEQKEIVFKKMLFSMYEIEFGFLRSRLKRVVDFVNRVDLDA